MRKSMNGRLHVFTAVVACVSSFCGCTSDFYLKSADREVKRLIGEKALAVKNMPSDFSIEVEPMDSLGDLSVYSGGDEFFGSGIYSERGAKVISLDRALELAVKHNRSYQNRKEIVYLEALSLSLDRHRFDTIASGVGGVEYKEDVQELAGAIDGLTTDRSFDGDSTVGFDRLFSFGGRVAADFTVNFFKLLSSEGATNPTSALTVTLTQPLLRGRGRKVTIENLTQAERDLLYELRRFTRFRKQFTVDIASSYYNVLRNRDRVRNNWRGYQNFKENVKREMALVKEGNRTLSDLGRVQQAEFSRQTSWIDSVRNYRQSLDAFKIELGLPSDANVTLDERELEQLEILHPNITVDEAVRIALVSRLDLQTSRDERDDAARKVELAKDGLGTDLDLTLKGSLDEKDKSGFPTPDKERHHWSAGLDVDLPFDRKAERNAYRASHIANERAVRELELTTDQIKLDILDGWRALEQAKSNYEISDLTVELNQRRVQEQKMLNELGRGSALDLVDAQTDLINAQNDRTFDLVSHTIARLRFWQNMGILYIKENGKWEDLNHENTENIN